MSRRAVEPSSRRAVEPSSRRAVEPSSRRAVEPSARSQKVESRQQKVASGLRQAKSQRPVVKDSPVTSRQWPVRPGFFPAGRCKRRARIDTVRQRREWKPDVCGRSRPDSLSPSYFLLLRNTLHCSSSNSLRLSKTDRRTQACLQASASCSVFRKRSTSPRNTTCSGRSCSDGQGLVQN